MEAKMANRDITNDGENPNATTLQTTDRFPFIQDGSPDTLKEITFANLAVETGKILLTYNSSTITTANLSCTENNVYNCTIAGLTANRNAVLPAPSAAGKVIRLTVLDGDATYVLVVIGDTGVTINGGSAATEWSRLFIAGESVTLESTSTSNWQVIEDGRIPCVALLERQAAQSINSASTTKIAVDAAVINRGGMGDVTTNDRINIRRAGNYDVRCFVSFSNVIDDQEYAEADLYVDGALDQFSRVSVSSASANQFASPRITHLAAYTAGQYLELYATHNEGAAQNTDTTYPPSIAALEIL